MRMPQIVASRRPKGPLALFLVRGGSLCPSFPWVRLSRCLRRQSDRKLPRRHHLDPSSMAMGAIGVSFPGSSEMPQALPDILAVSRPS
jgi:hypothetical protein